MVGVNPINRYVDRDGPIGTVQSKFFKLLRSVVLGCLVRGIFSSFGNLQTITRTEEAPFLTIRMESPRFASGSHAITRSLTLGTT